MSYTPTALGLHMEHRPNPEVKKAVSLSLSGSCLCVHVATWLLVTAEHRQGLLVFVWRLLPRYILSLQLLVCKIYISFLHEREFYEERGSACFEVSDLVTSAKITPNLFFWRGCEAQKGTCPSQTVNHLCQEVSINALQKHPGNNQDLQLLLPVSLAVCVGVQALQRGTLLC